jgi:hypothetical protein
VRTRVLQMSAAALAVALVGAAGAGARAQATSITLTAVLNAAQEVPAPTGEVTAAKGAFAATLTRTAEGATLNWTLNFEGLTGPATAAHIHSGARGAPGAVVIPLCGPCTTGATGTFNVTDPSLLVLLQNGGAYANVHTGTNRGGEIRGQLSIRSAVRSALTAGKEVPKPTGTRRGARGTFTGTITKSDTGAVLNWRLTFNRLTGRAVAAHIHLGRAGRAGPVALALCGPCRSGRAGRANLTASLQAALAAGRAYVNVHTAKNPAGEVRGQIPPPALSLS